MHLKKYWFPLLAGLQVFYLVTGCDALYSKRVNMNVPTTQGVKPTPGNAFYSLPKVELVLTAVLTNVPSTNYVFMPVVSTVYSNILVTTITNFTGQSISQSANPAAAAPPLVLTVTTNSLTLGTTATNGLNLTAGVNTVVLTPGTNAVTLNANNIASPNLVLPVGTMVITNITFVTTNSSVTMTDDKQVSVVLNQGTNYLHFNPQAAFSYLTPTTSQPPYADNKPGLTLYTGTWTNPPAASLPAITGGTGTTTVSQVISVISSNSIMVPVTNQVYAVTVTNFFTSEPRGLFALKIAPDRLGTYSETYGIQIDNNGFISSVNASNSDQTVQIITELAQDVAAITGVAPGPPLPAHALMQTGPPVHPSVVSVIFDPTSTESIEAANESIARQFNGSPNNPIMILPEDPGLNPLTSLVGTNDDYLTNYNDSFSGIAYRPLKPFIVSVSNGLAPLGPSFQQYLVMSPNQSPLLNVPIKRAAFVTRTTGLTFSGGFLTAANYSRPSQMAALAGLPASVVGMYISTVTNLLEAKFNIATGQANLQNQAFTQQAALLSDTTNLLQEEKDFHAFLKAEAAKPVLVSTNSVP